MNTYNEQLDRINNIVTRYTNGTLNPTKAANALNFIARDIDNSSLGNEPEGRELVAAIYNATAAMTA